jgi:hypothetical protein
MQDSIYLYGEKFWNRCQLQLYSVFFMRSLVRFARERAKCGSMSVLSVKNFFVYNFSVIQKGRALIASAFCHRTAHFFLTTQTTTATMSNDRTRSLPSSSFSSFAGEARSRPRRRIEDDPRRAPAPDPAAAQPSLAAEKEQRCSLG